MFVIGRIWTSQRLPEDQSITASLAQVLFNFSSYMCVESAKGVKIIYTLSLQRRNTIE